MWTMDAPISAQDTFSSYASSNQTADSGAPRSSNGSLSLTSILGSGHHSQQSELSSGQSRDGQEAESPESGEFVPIGHDSSPVVTDESVISHGSPGISG